MLININTVSGLYVCLFPYFCFFRDGLPNTTISLGNGCITFIKGPQLLKNIGTKQQKCDRHIYVQNKENKIKSCKGKIMPSNI